MFDALERRIHVGDVVTYPVRRGSAMYIRAGRVVGLDLDGVRGIEVDVKGKIVKVTETDRVTIAVSGVDVRAAREV